MLPRHLQRLLQTAPSGCPVKEFKPVSLGIRDRLMSSNRGTAPMSLEAKIRFLHDYSACDVRFYSIALLAGMRRRTCPEG